MTYRQMLCVGFRFVCMCAVLASLKNTSVSVGDEEKEYGDTIFLLVGLAGGAGLFFMPVVLVGNWIWVYLGEIVIVLIVGFMNFILLSFVLQDTGINGSESATHYGFLIAILYMAMHPMLMLWKFKLVYQHLKSDAECPDSPSPVQSCEKHKDHTNE